MEQAIKKAIEGGWKPIYARGNKDWVANYNNITYIGKHHLYDTLLDTKFWQALGKAEGWNTIDGKTDIIYCHKEKEWQGYMHKFTDHIIEDKDIDSFFKELLK